MGGLHLKKKKKKKDPRSLYHFLVKCRSPMVAIVTTAELLLYR